MYTKEAYAEKIKAANEALTAFVQAQNADKPLKRAVDNAHAKLTEAVAEYNKLVRSDAYEALFTNMDNMQAGPIRAAMKQYRFAGLMRPEIKYDKDTNRVKTSSLKISTDADHERYKEVFTFRLLEKKYEELEKAAELEHSELMASADWAAKIAGFAGLINKVTRVEDGMSLDEARTAHVSADRVFYVQRGKKWVATDGADLTDADVDGLSQDLSTGAMKEQLQGVIDAILFDTGTRDDGKNSIRARERDVRYIRDHARTFNAKTHGSSDLPDATAHELIFCAIAHILSKEPYAVEEKK